MKHDGMRRRGPISPSEHEATLALTASRTLGARIGGGGAVRIRVLEEDRETEPVALPAAALQVLLDALEHLGRGHAVIVTPVHAELTTQQAADFLQVSRPHLIQLLEARKIPYHKVGAHRRVRLDDILAYKSEIDRQRRGALDELAAQAQDLRMGY